MTFGDLQEGLDKFYSEVANRPIPIFYAMSLIAGKARGTLTEAEVQDRAIEMRKAIIEDAQGHPVPPPPPPPRKEVTK